MLPASRLLCVLIGGHALRSGPLHVTLFRHAPLIDVEQGDNANVARR